MLLRPATEGDLDALLDVQQAGAVEALSHIFPQDSTPFPRDLIRRRWAEEIADPETFAYVIAGDDGRVIGFAATREAEILHFGTALETWGSGLATHAHDAIVASFAEHGLGPRIRLRVFEENHRARRFYEKLGWRPTGERSRTTFPPHPTLVTYEFMIGSQD